MKKEEDDDENGFVLPLVRWVYDPANQANLSGVLLIPRVSNFRVTISQFRRAIDAIDAKHNTRFLDHVPHVIADEEAFNRTAQHFRHNGGSLLRVPQPASRNPRYTWAAQVVDAVTEMVSMQGRAWLEFRRDSTQKSSGVVYYSSAADSGYAMPPAVSAEFESDYNRNKLTFGTSDCRTMVSAMLKELAAKSIGRNIWFIPAMAKLEVFADLMNAINGLAGYTALVVFEIAKTTQNNEVAKQVITEVFKRHLTESEEAINEYIADMHKYTLDPQNNKMRYVSRAKRNLAEINTLLSQAQLYADVMADVAESALEKARNLQHQWQTKYTTALLRDGNFDGVSAMLTVGEMSENKDLLATNNTTSTDD